MSSFYEFTFVNMRLLLVYRLFWIILYTVRRSEQWLGMTDQTRI